MTTITIHPERCHEQTITLYAHSTVELVKHEPADSANTWYSLLVDGRHYRLVMAKFTYGRPEIMAAMEQALADVQAAIDSLRMPEPPPPAPVSFPSTEQIAAALETLLDAAQRTYDLSDRHDKEERAFWRRQRNAYINAQADFLSGRIPLVSGDAYLMPSASRPGAYHRCWRVGGVWCCSCEAGDQGVFHRHTALISAIEYAMDLVEQGLVGESDPTDDTPPTPIAITPTADGLSLSRGEQAFECRTPEDVAGAVKALTARLCAAKARIAA